MQVAPFLHWPRQSSKFLEQVGPPQPSWQTHWKDPGRLMQRRAFRQGPALAMSLEGLSEPFVEVMGKEYRCWFLWNVLRCWCCCCWSCCCWTIGYITLHSLTSNWQTSPVHSSGHSHRKPPIRSMQVPPCLQGPPAHSSISVNHRFCKYFCFDCFDVKRKLICK